jgi:hypothetical protein
MILVMCKIAIHSQGLILLLLMLLEACTTRTGIVPRLEACTRMGSLYSSGTSSCARSKRVVVVIAAVAVVIDVVVAPLCYHCGNSENFARNQK